MSIAPHSRLWFQSAPRAYTRGDDTNVRGSEEEEESFNPRPGLTPEATKVLGLGELRGLFQSAPRAYTRGDT